MPERKRTATPAKPKAAPKPPGDKVSPEVFEKVRETTAGLPTVPPGPIIYPKLEMREFSTASESGPLGPQDWKDILGWETEPEYKVRMCRERPGTKPEDWAFGELGPKRPDNGERQPIHCVNTRGEPVVCWNNSNNRSFDSGWCEEQVDMILKGAWAGPHTIPGETVNGETVRISRRARVLSGQHQGSACILADEKLQEARKKDNPLYPTYPFWVGQPNVFIETIVVYGLSEDERVLRTIDYVKPRTVADMLYTMAFFRDRTPPERKELTRMLAAASDTLWYRTETKGYKTHPEVVAFLERHKRLLRCVEHLFRVNGVQADGGGRRINRLRLSAGQAAALCYLMGCSSDKTTDYSDFYRNEQPAPSEKNLDWSLEERAYAFWMGLADDRGFMPVRVKLNRLKESSPTDEDNMGLGGRNDEKLAILAKAWAIFKDHPDHAGPPFNDDDLLDDGALALHYNNLDDKGEPLPEGKVKLLDQADFLGIDCAGITKTKGGASAKAAPVPPPPTREEIERAMEEARRRHGILSPDELRKQNEETEKARAGRK